MSYYVTYLLVKIRHYNVRLLKGILPLRAPVITANNSCISFFILIEERGIDLDGIYLSWHLIASARYLFL